MNHGLEDNLFLDSLMHNNDNNDKELDNSLTMDERVGICIDLFTAGVDAVSGTFSCSLKVALLDLFNRHDCCESYNVYV